MPGATWSWSTAGGSGHPRHFLPRETTTTTTPRKFPRGESTVSRLVGNGEGGGIVSGRNDLGGCE